MERVQDIVNSTDTVYAVRFVYNGASRIVDDIAFVDGDIVGFEMRKSGKFSYKVKRFSESKIHDLFFIVPPKRSGPKIGRING